MNKSNNIKLFITIIAVSLLISVCEGQRRCFACRSRGKLGDCKDHFPFNATHLVRDVEAIGCASGWCNKVIEGDPNGEDHDLATARSCLQRPPPDNTERCGEVVWDKRRVYACFCAGDLCNSSTVQTASHCIILGALIASILRYISTS